MPDPFSAVVQRLYRRDSTSLLIALLLGYALAAFVLGATVTGGLRWMIGSTAVLAFGAAFLAFAFAFLARPERLRSEETVRMDMVLAWLNRPDVDDVQRKAAERLLPIVFEKKLSKRSDQAIKPSGDDHA